MRKINRESNHSDEERCLVETWDSLEVQQAIKQKILKTYEVWHFEKTSEYKKEAKSSGLFTKYKEMNLKGKQEASGFPKEVVTEVDSH